MAVNMNEKPRKEITFIGSLKSVPKGGETVKNSILIEALEKRGYELKKINKDIEKLRTKRERQISN